LERQIAASPAILVNYLGSGLSGNGLASLISRSKKCDYVRGIHNRRLLHRIKSDAGPRFLIRLLLCFGHRIFASASCTGARSLDPHEFDSCQTPCDLFNPSPVAWYRVAKKY